MVAARITRIAARRTALRLRALWCLALSPEYADMVVQQ